MGILSCGDMFATTYTSEFYIAVSFPWFYTCKYIVTNLLQLYNLKDFQHLSCSLLWAADQYLPDTMNHVLSCVKKEKERTAAFQALGLLSVAVRSEFQAYLPKVLEIIKAALPPKDFAHK